MLFIYRKQQIHSRYHYFLILIFLISSFLVIGNAEAIPAFARKYEANCALCHSNEPRLTQFGQRFLENGYQFPSTQDGAETSKMVLEGEQGPVTLDTLSTMMAVRIRADIQRANFREISPAMDAEGVDQRISVEVPKIVNFFFGGTATKNISYFLEAEYNTMESNGGETSVKFERGYMQFSNLGGAQGVTNIKVGRFDPSSLFAFPTHRQQLNPILPIAKTDKYPPQINRIPLLPLAFASKMFGLTTASTPAGSLVGDGFSEGFAILPFQPYLYNAPVQSGVQLHGRPFGDNSSFMYQLGTALNKEATTQDQRIDYYVMLRFELPFTSMDSQISGFYYNAPNAARATLVNIMPLMNDPADNKIVYAKDRTDIERWGIGYRAQWSEFDIYATYIMDFIDNPQWAAAPLQTSQWDTSGAGFTAEMDWRFHSNWMFGVRYDWMQPGGLERLPAVATATGSVNDKINQAASFLAPIIKYYPSPNIGLYVRTHINLLSSKKLPNTNGRVDGFNGQVHPATNLENIWTFGVDMAF